jgi:hypothetical protein
MSGLVIHPKSSNLWFRMVVPPRHRATLGKTEIKFSLGTADRAKAQAAHAAAKTKWRQVFRDLDRDHDTVDRNRASTLVADALRTLAESNAIDESSSPS